jgi:hypothetical protein
MGRKLSWVSTIVRWCLSQLLATISWCIQRLSLIQAGGNFRRCSTTRARLHNDVSDNSDPGLILPNSVGRKRHIPMTPLAHGPFCLQQRDCFFPPSSCRRTQCYKHRIESQSDEAASRTRRQRQHQRWSDWTLIHMTPLR